MNFKKLILNECECQLTRLRFSETFQAGGRTIFTNKSIICGKWYQFAQLEPDARFVEPSIACGAQQLQYIQIPIFAAKIEQQQ